MVNFGEVFRGTAFLFVVICLNVLLVMVDKEYDELKQQVSGFKQCMEYNFEELVM